MPGPAGSFEIRRGAPLTIVADGRVGAAASWLADEDLPDDASRRSANISLLFERTGGAITRRGWGPNGYLRGGRGGQFAIVRSRFGASSPAATSTTTRGSARPPVVERGGRLWIGTETPMTKIGDNLWRVGEESWSPERASFADFIDGRPQTFMFSGEKFLRHDI